MIPEHIKPYAKYIGEIGRYLITTEAIRNEFPIQENSKFSFPPGVLRQGIKAEYICELLYRDNGYSLFNSRDRRCWHGTILRKIKKFISVCKDQGIIKECFNKLDLNLTKEYKFDLYEYDPVTCYFLVKELPPVDNIGIEQAGSRIFRTSVKKEFVDAFIKHNWPPHKISEDFWDELMLFGEPKYIQYFVDSIPKIQDKSMIRRLIKTNPECYQCLTLKHLKDSPFTAKESVLLLGRAPKGAEFKKITEKDIDSLKHDVFMDCVSGNSKASVPLTRSIKRLKDRVSRNNSIKTSV